MQQTLWMVGSVSMFTKVFMVGSVTVVGTVSIVGTVTTVTMVPTVLSGTINYFYFNLGGIFQILYFKNITYYQIIYKFLISFMFPQSNYNITSNDFYVVSILHIYQFSLLSQCLMGSGCSKYQEIYD